MRRSIIIMIVIVVASMLFASQAIPKNTNGKILVKYSPEGEKINDLRWETDSNYSAFLPLGIDSMGQVIVLVDDYLQVFNSAMEEVRKGDYCAQKLLIDSDNNYLLQVTDGIIKTDEEFNEIWKIENIHLDLETEPIFLDEMNNLYYINNTCPSPDEYVTLIKYAETGEKIWNVTLSGEKVNSCVRQNIVFDNYCSTYWLAYGTETVDYENLLSKYSADAELIWQIEIFNSYNLMAWNRMSDRLILVGSEGLSFYSTDGELLSDIMISDLDIAKSQYFDANVIKLDAEGQMVLLFIDRGQEENLTVIKFSLDGAMLWQVSFNYPFTDGMDYQLRIDNEDNIIVSGLSCVDVNDCRCVLIKLDSDGTLMWEKSLPRCYSQDLPCNVALDEDDNIYLAGYYGYEADDDDDEPGCGCF